MPPSSPDAGPRDPCGGWVFAYGSLMWNWPWPHLLRRPARLEGYHRAPCLASIAYRGTVRDPGVGLGLLPGGACLGLAFGVAAQDWPAVRRAVDERELITGVYDRHELAVQLLGPRVDHVQALAYVASPQHPQFLQQPDEETLVHRIAFARGSAGDCFDYWRETLSTLAALGIEEPGLSGLLERAAERRKAHAPQNTGTAP